jgi:hypothetical protein
LLIWKPKLLKEIRNENQEKGIKIDVYMFAFKLSVININK